MADAAPEAGEDGPRFVVLRGRKKGRLVPVEGGALVLTRRTGAGAMNDPEVSSRHAEVVKTPAGYLIRDLQSTNGTFVNGRSIQEAILASGDEVVVGRTVLRWEAGVDRGPELSPPRPERLGMWAPTMELDPRQESRRSARNMAAGPWAQLAGIEATPLIIEDTRAPLSDVEGYELMDVNATGLPLKVPPRVQVILEIVEGPEKGRVVTFTRGEVTIGRYGTDVVVKDSDISRAHATIYVFGQDQIFIRDLKSTNGTFVNGVRVRFSKVQSGDTVVVGRSLIHLIVRRVS